MSTSISLPTSTKLGNFRLSPHPTAIGNSSSISNGGTNNSPNSVLSVMKKEESVSSSTVKVAVSQSKPTPAEMKLSSFGMPRLFSRIQITLENSLLPEEKLSTPPSLQDGMDMETERDLRYLGSELIQKASILLKLPQVAAATGQILYQRFYYAKSLVRYDFEHTAMACVSLASKIEEAPRRFRDVMNVFHHLRQLMKNRENGSPNAKIPPLMLDKEYVRVKNEIIKSERRVLKELGFCVHVKHPHKLVYAYLKALDALDKKELIQRAWCLPGESCSSDLRVCGHSCGGSRSRFVGCCSWNYMNDSLRTDVFLRHTPETIACSCVFLAARDLGIPLPEQHPYQWWELFDANYADMEDICRILIHLYRRKKPTWRQLETRWMDAKKRLMDKQQEGKPIGSTPNPNATGTPAGKRSPSVTAEPPRQARSPGRKREDRPPKRDNDIRKSSKDDKPRTRKRSRSQSPRSRSRSRSLIRERDRYHQRYRPIENRRKEERRRSPSPFGKHHRGGGRHKY